MFAWRHLDPAATARAFRWLLSDTPLPQRSVAAPFDARQMNTPAGPGLRDDQQQAPGSAANTL
jgi:hypothetical protein